MRRAPWYRLLAGLLAIWFPQVVAEPMVAQACPMANHVAHDMAHHSSGSHHSAPHRACVCPSCSASTIEAPEPAAVPVPVVAIGDGVADGVWPAEAPARSADRHARPYTTGPPRG